MARISLANGDVSVRRGDNGQSTAAAGNAPMMTGDTIATGPGGRAEIQFDQANRFRLGHDGQARLADLAPGQIRIELARGTASFSVLRDTTNQLEVSTPNVAVRAGARGLYRVWVRDDGQTVITVRHGEAEVFSQQGTEKLPEGQTMFVKGPAQDPEFQVVAASQSDEWDSWNEQRDRMLDQVKSYQYVNPGVTGVEDLDANGTWVNDPAYGEVWAPRVAPDWAPYRAGRWVYEDYYGWTWVSDDPWGWAPYHYGNWYYGSVGWCWYPGSLYRPVFWRPAMVAFFGFGRGVGVGFGFGGFGSIGWVPLAPFEPFSAWYGRGWGGRFASANIAGVYRNARVNGAVSGVAAGAFASGRFSAINRVRPMEMAQAGLVRGHVPMAPTANSYRLSDRATSVLPRPMAGTPFVSHTSASPSAAASPWDRFGTPNRTGAMPAARANQGWGTFGTPNRSGGAATSGWNQFNAPAAQRYGAPSSAGLRVSPQIMHNRAYDAPAPRQAAPRPAPKSAPASHSGGGGSHHGR